MKTNNHTSNFENFLNNYNKFKKGEWFLINLFDEEELLVKINFSDDFYFYVRRKNNNKIICIYHNTYNSPYNWHLFRCGNKSQNYLYTTTLINLLINNAKNLLGNKIYYLNKEINKFIYENYTE